MNSTKVTLQVVSHYKQILMERWNFGAEPQRQDQRLDWISSVSFLRRFPLAYLRGRQPRPGPARRRRSPCRWRRRPGSSRHGSAPSWAPGTSPRRCWGSGRGWSGLSRRWWCWSAAARGRQWDRREATQDRDSDYRRSASLRGREREEVGETHPDSLHHEADVADAHEVGALVDGVDGLDVAGDLRGRHAGWRCEAARQQAN